MLIINNHECVLSLQPLWLMEPKEVTHEQHTEFYKFISNSYDKPRFTLHYKTDAPLSIRSILYVPEGKPGLFELSRDSDVGVALYSRKILIKSKAENILPKWLRFVKGNEKKLFFFYIYKIFCLLTILVIIKG